MCGHASGAARTDPSSARHSTSSCPSTVYARGVRSIFSRASTTNHPPDGSASARASAFSIRLGFACTQSGASAGAAPGGGSVEGLVPNV